MIELNWCVHFQDHKEEMAHHEMTRRLAQQWNNLSQEDKKVQYHASCRTVSGWKKDQKQSKQTKIISETWMTYESHLPGKLSFFPHITLHGAAWIFAFRGHQPLMDGKHCVTPGRTTHQCPALMCKFCCNTANSKVNTITDNFYLGVSTTTGSDKPWSSILDSDLNDVRTKVPSAGVSHAICCWFPNALPEYLTVRSELPGKCMNC